MSQTFTNYDAIRRTHQKWVDEALAGKFRIGSVKRLRLIGRKARIRSGNNSSAPSGRG
jgi:hypothetical protein